MRKRTYVAGPYTRPDPCVNTHAALLVANQLWEVGFMPFVPHLTHFWHTVTPRPYEFWLEYDTEMLACCDYLVRLPGESAGADREVAFARERGIPVFFGVDAFLAAVAP